MIRSTDRCQKASNDVLRLIRLSILFVLISVSAVAQQSFAKIEKNVNLQARDVIHELNADKDTLVLRSDKPIDGLYSVHEDRESEMELFINSTSFELPLRNLSKGRHLFVAVQAPKQIVFVVEIFEENTNPIHVKVAASRTTRPKTPRTAIRSMF